VETDPTWDAVRADLIAILAGLAWRKRRCDRLLAEFRNELRRSPGSHTEVAAVTRRVVAEQARAIARHVEIEMFLRQTAPFTEGIGFPSDRREWQKSSGVVRSLRRRIGLGARHQGSGEM
jgi:hypothetical protein